ncbi:hypothetical protein ACWD4O_15900 [Streptomyces sp. NPDC002623]
MTEYLGPLELVGDRWIIGDPKREGGSCLVLTAEGMEHHEPGAPEPLAVVPWSKFVELGIRATYQAWHATRTMGVLGVLGGGHLETGRSGCSVGGLLRHPYESWSVNYTHHERPYTGDHVYVVNALFQRTSEARTSAPDEILQNPTPDAAGRRRTARAHASAVALLVVDEPRLESVAVGVETLMSAMDVSRPSSSAPGSPVAFLGEADVVTQPCDST